LSLTNRENAFIQPEKLIDYLLSENHPVGKSKAKFFRELGFNEENVTFLEQELSKIVRNQDVTEVITTEHGKYLSKINYTYLTPSLPLAPCLLPFFTGKFILHDYLLNM